MDDIVSGVRDSIAHRLGSDHRSVGAAMSQYRQRQLQAVADAAARNRPGRDRRRCFVSFHPDDSDEVEAFLARFGAVFLARTIGVAEHDLEGHASRDDVLDQIRRRYLRDTTVTIVLVGERTWSSTNIEWEVDASLRRGRHNLVNGLLAIRLPSVADDRPRLPMRVADNISLSPKDKQIGYGRWHAYPSTTTVLKGLIEDAHNARTTRADLIDDRSRR